MDNSKRQAIACDVCRKSKKKCDGASPCNRCKVGNKVCTYTPLKRRTICKKYPKTTSITTLNSELSNQTLCKKYLEIYFEHINPVDLITNFKIGSYDSIQSKGTLLQYNAALATATRSKGTPRLYRGFEKRAVQLASELIGEFTFEAAFGYYLLAFHLWGEDESLGMHYREISNSICNRLLIQNKKANKPINQILKLQLGLYVISGEISSLKKDSQSLKEIFDESNHLPEPLFPIENNISVLYSFKTKFFSIVLKDAFDESFNDNPFRSLINDELPIDEISNLCNDLLNYERVCQILFTSRNSNDFSNIVAMVTNFYRSILFYITGSYNLAVYYGNLGIDIADSYDYIVTLISPTFSMVFHLIFMVAYLSNNHKLCKRVNFYQKKLAEKLPSSRFFFDSDLNLLKSKFNHHFQPQYDDMDSDDLNISSSDYDDSSPELHVSSSDSIPSPLLFSTCSVLHNLDHLRNSNVDYLIELQNQLIQNHRNPICIKNTPLFDVKNIFPDSLLNNPLYDDIEKLIYYSPSSSPTSSSSYGYNHQQHMTDSHHSNENLPRVVELKTEPFTATEQPRKSSIFTKDFLETNYRFVDNNKPH